MRPEIGLELGAHTCRRRLVIVRPRNERSGCGCSARHSVGHTNGLIEAAFRSITSAESRINHRVVGNVIFRPELAEDVAERRVLPGLAIIGRGVRDSRNDTGDHQLGALVLHLHPLIDNIERQAEGAAVIVEGATKHIGAAEFIVDRYVAAPRRAVDADTPFAVRAEAAADVEGAADMLRPRIVEGHAVEIPIASALRHQVDAAADTCTARCRAVDERTGAVKHLDRLGQFGRY